MFTCIMMKAAGIAFGGAIALWHMLSATGTRQLAPATYRALHRLDGRTLADLGLDRSQIEALTVGGSRS